MPELIERNLLSPELAAWLWLLIERGVSIVICAGPSGAGKSTLAAALTAFLPPDRTPYLVQGVYDELEEPRSRPARATTLLINELSRHLPAYVWGAAARRALAAGEAGAQFVATAHARVPEELIWTLSSPAIGATPEQLRLWDVAIFIDAGHDRGGIDRRISGIVSYSLRAERGARWRRLATGQLRGAPALEGETLVELATSRGVPAESIAPAIERRIAVLRA